MNKQRLNNSLKVFALIFILQLISFSSAFASYLDLNQLIEAGIQEQEQAHLELKKSININQTEDSNISTVLIPSTENNNSTDILPEKLALDPMGLE